MGRLIDKDELVEEIKSLKIVLDGKDIFPTAAKDTVLRIISEQPTAYDPDEVVEKLGKLKKAEQGRPDDCDEDGCGDGEQIYDDGRSQGRYEAFGKAIQIVKGGGVDG